MQRILWVLFLLLGGFFAATAVAQPDKSEFQQRRQQIARSLREGILLLHANPRLDIAADGFRQDAGFYYFTGLENSPGALFALDCRSGETWLFVPTHVPFDDPSQRRFSATVDEGTRAGISHVVDWSELQPFLASRAKSDTPLYYIGEAFAVADLPPNISGAGKSTAPLWVNTIAKTWPSFKPQDVTDRFHYLSAVESASELSSSRAAGKATVSAFGAGLRAIKPGVSQRKAETAVENACWMADARGSSFWPWVMAGQNAVFPNPFTSVRRYDHLNTEMRAGDLVRLDVGCEVNHYGGDLGRTVPVSGHYTDEQREIWNVLVAAYKAAAASLRDGVTVDQIYEAWRAELLNHRDAVKSVRAKRAIELWSVRKNVPYWQIHTMNLDAAFIEGPFRAGMVVDFEPIVSIDELGFYLEDMFLITRQGTELLTPGAPYTAEEIEAAMR